jgi:hypothetical protein
MPCSCSGGAPPALFRRAPPTCWPRRGCRRRSSASSPGPPARRRTARTTRRSWRSAPWAPSCIYTCRTAKGKSLATSWRGPAGFDDILEPRRGWRRICPGPDVAQHLLGRRERVDGPLDEAVNAREVAHHARAPTVGLLHEEGRADPLRGLLTGTITPESITFFEGLLAAACEVHGDLPGRQHSRGLHRPARHIFMGFPFMGLILSSSKTSGNFFR